MKKNKGEEEMFVETDLEKIICQVETNPLLVLLGPNYEERSSHVAKKIAGLRPFSGRKVKFELISFRNLQNNDVLLEGLKNKYCHKVCTLLNIDSDDINWFVYPKGFSVESVRSFFNTKIDEISEENGLDILLDVSTIPRGIIFTICEFLRSYMKEYPQKIHRLYFTYVSPRQYSKLNYAQDIGIISSYFSGEVLKSWQKTNVNVIIFPGRSGHEGKLLVDNLSQICTEQRRIVFFPIDTEQYLQSLGIMRANQILLDHENNLHYYYCSVGDAAIGLHSYLKNQVERLKIIKETYPDLQKQHYLIAPFGSKIFTAVSYFELMAMRDSLPDYVDIEICHVKGFQYTSVYSIGIGMLSVLEWRENGE